MTALIAEHGATVTVIVRAGMLTFIAYGLYVFGVTIADNAPRIWSALKGEGADPFDFDEDAGGDD